MDRRRFNHLLLSAGVFSAFSARAQVPRSKARVGVLLALSAQASRHLLDAFLRRLSELGWMEGKNLEILLRESQGDQQRYALLAAELIAQKPDVIFAPFVYVALVVKTLTRDIPVVFSYENGKSARPQGAAVDSPARGPTDRIAGRANRRVIML